MSNTKTHWKKAFNYDYLGAYSIPEGQDLILTIKGFKKSQVKGTGGKVEECLTLDFIENDKPMIMNRSNCKTIASIYDTSFMEDWIGKQIQLYVKRGIHAFGTVTDGLRIRESIPKRANPENTEKAAVGAEIRGLIVKFPSKEYQEQIKGELNAKRAAKEDTVIFLSNYRDSLVEQLEDLDLR